MAKRVAQSEPALEFSFFSSGFYTYRSQLFAPFRSIGINVVSFKDPVIDGADMENTDKLEWQRRPGFSKFCPTQLAGNEIVNQFYSSRNLNGQVTAFFDSTLELASFTSSGITPIINPKSTTAQGYITTVGNMTYFSDGTSTDTMKWGSPNGSQAAPALSAWGLAAPTITPIISGTGFWQPNYTFYSFNSIVDQNGNVEVVGVSNSAGGVQTTVEGAFATITIASSHGGTWIPATSGASYYRTSNGLNVPNQFSNYIYLTNFNFTIPTGATVIGIVAKVYKQADMTPVFPPQTGMLDNSVKLVVAGSPTGTDQSSTDLWSEGSFGESTYGSPTTTWGASAPTPAQVNAVGSFGFAISAKVQTRNDGYPYIQFGATMTVYYTLGGGGTSGISGPNLPVFSQTIAGITNDGGLQWTNYGPVLVWLPDQYYPTPAVIVDTNGNLQLATTVNNPIEIWDSGTGYTVGEIVSFGGSYWVATRSSTGIAPSANYTVATTSGSITTTETYWSPCASPLQTGATAPAWMTTLGAVTVDSGYHWINIGPGTFVESFGTSYVYGFRTIYGHLTTSSPVSMNTGTILGPQPVSISSFAIASNVVTFQGVNNFLSGNTFTVEGLDVGTYLNGQAFTVLASGLSTTQFSASFVYPDTSSTPDSGTTVNLIATVTGQGTDSPLCNSMATITASAVSANVVQLTAANNFVPGLYVTFSGLTTATFLNNLQLQVINVDPNGTWFQVYFVTPNQDTTADTGTVIFNAVEVYRVSDGGGIYLFAGAVTNPGFGASWFYNDFTTDADLNVLQIAPQSNLNDPPPGAPGSTIPTPATITIYWQGRIWMVVGNYVYFTAGPDCINGIPEESCPPANRFQYAGPVLGLKPTPDKVGLLVYLADRVAVILGGPETISFYTMDFLDNFGISNPNALFKDGSTIGQFTTQKQFFALTGGEGSGAKTDEGARIADYLADNFPAISTYATIHRNGLDVGMWLSNGTDQVLRLGTNIDTWSVPYNPVGGAGALNSIETSVGTYSLMLASPAGGGYLLARDLTTNQDNGENYADCFITLGSITLSQPGAELFPLQHVVGYFDAVGTRPNISILPNEISAATSFGFIELPDVQQEPPVGQNRPSTSLMALRWPVDMMNSSLASQFIHHLQVRVQFQPENFPNTLKSLAFKSQQDI